MYSNSKWHTNWKQQAELKKWGRQTATIMSDRRNLVIVTMEAGGRRNSSSIKETEMAEEK